MNNAARNRDARTRALMVLAFISAGYFVLCLAVLAMTVPPMSDDAYIASAVKNMALGIGWASSYGRIFFLDPEITTGPAFLWPAAMLMKIWGPEIWAPRLIALFLNVLLAIGLFMLLKNRWGKKQWLVMVIILPLLMSRLLPIQWVSTLGDLPATLYFFIAMACIADGLEKHDRKRLFFGGLILGAALITKTIVLILIPGVACMLIWHAHVCQGRYVSWRMCTNSIIIALGLLIPLTGWQLYQGRVLEGLSQEEQLIVEELYRFFFYRGGSGLDGLLQAFSDGVVPSYLFKAFQNNVQFYAPLLSAFPGPNAVWFWGILLFVFILPLAMCFKKPEASDLFLLGSSISTAVYFVWVLFFGNHIFDHHFYIALFFWAINFSVVLTQKWMVGLIAAVFIAAGIIYKPDSNPLTGELYKPAFHKSSLYTALEKVQDFLRQHPSLGPLAGCGSIVAWELEYALPSVNNFSNCHVVIGNSVKFDHQRFIERYPQLFQDTTEPDYHAALHAFIRDQDRVFGPSANVTAPVTWEKLPETIVVVENVFGRFFRESPTIAHNYSWIVSGCQVLYDDPPFYRVYECSANDIENYLVERGGLTFVPLGWRVQDWKHHRQASANTPRKITAPTQ